MVRVFKDSLQLSKEAAEIFVHTAKEAVHDRGKFIVALTGGSSPIQLYQLLADSPYREQVPWQHTFVFWGDERWVPLADEQSNFRMAQELLLSHVAVPKNQIFPMWQEQKPEIFARQYEDQLRKYLDERRPQFDLILLGMGDDGHTASLFPGMAVLNEKEQWVSAYYLEQQDMYRITLTAPLINQARKIIFLTFGEKKANALSEVLEGERNPEKFPAQLINVKDGEVLWLVDEAAGQKLSSQK